MKPENQHKKQENATEPQNKSRMAENCSKATADIGPFWLQIYEIALNTIRPLQNRIYLVERTKIMKKALQNLKRFCSQNTDLTKTDPILEKRISIVREQFLYELYEFPVRTTKAPQKSIVIYDGLLTPLIHSSDLTLDDVGHVYGYYKPTELPDFDSYRSASVSAEMAAFLTRMLGAVFAEHVERACRVKSEDLLKEGKCMEKLIFVMFDSYML